MKRRQPKRSTPKIDIRQIAKLAFDAVPEVRGMPQAKRIKHTNELVADVRIATLVGVEIVAMSKAELIARAAEKYDAFGAALMHLADARENADALLMFISSAEARLAVALANVEATKVVRS